MKLATWRAMSAPMAPTKSSDTRRIPNRKTTVATPRRQPRRARKLTPGSMANDRNSEIAMRNRRVCRRENSHRPTSVAMKPSQNTTTARRTHRGMGAAPAAGSSQGRSAAPVLPTRLDGGNGGHRPSVDAGLLRPGGPSAGAGRGGPTTSTASRNGSGGGTSPTRATCRGGAGAPGRRRSHPSPRRRTVRGDHARELFDSDGPRWFGPDRPIWRVHADASIFVGALRALLLQSLHPLAMAGVADHSDYRADPWGRLQRTARFLAATTYGTEAQAEQACATVRRVHRRVHGIAPDGRPYDANDPHLLTWVHIAEADSFLAAYQRYGAHPLDPAERTRTSATWPAWPPPWACPTPPLGRRAPGPPRRLPARAGRHAGGQRGRPLLAAATSRAAGRPRPVHGARRDGGLAAAVVGQGDAPHPAAPVTETVVIRPAGRVLVDAMRWALSPGSPMRDTPRDVATGSGSGTLAR